MCQYLLQVLTDMSTAEYTVTIACNMQARVGEVQGEYMCNYMQILLTMRVILSSFTWIALKSWDIHYPVTAGPARPAATY